MKVQFKCFLDNHNSDVCHISHEIFSFFELNEDLIYKLHLGKTNSQVKLRPINYKESNNQNIIYVNPSVFKPSFSDDELINLDRINLNIWIKDINIYIGPVLGIFVKPKLLSVPKKKTARFIHLEAGIKKNFLCYLFSVDSVDWSKHRVKGLTYVPKWNKWTKIWLPLPNAVYDRRSGFTKEQRQKAGQIRRMFKKEFNIKYINRVNYFGKWKPYRELKKYDAIANYLPHTIRYKSFNDVLKMIRTYDFFFLKSFYGSQGKQIISIEKLTSNKYKIRYFKKGMREVEVNDLEQFKVQIKSFVRNKNYIIQQGIRLLRYKGYSFDLRVLVYKNNKGLWNVIKNYARVARKQDQILTNYSLGGKRLFYDKLYPQLYSIKGESVPKSHHIEKAALQIASCIDNELGPFGELGIDFAIDIHGKLWLLEINTNPGKGPGHYYRNNDYAPEYKYVFDYAEYLCGVFF